MTEEPSVLGNGVGTLLADYLPFMPSGARRAGSASLMAERLGQDPGLLLKYPMLSQLVGTGAGGLLAATQPSGAGKLAAGILPLILVQAMKRQRIQDVDHDYAAAKTHKRLREVGEVGEVADRSMGSHRLGLVQAYEAMRKRKLSDIGVMSEAADALPIAGMLSGVGAATTVPITGMIDHMSADRISKSADFTDQREAPVIPLFLASAIAAAGGMQAAGRHAQQQLTSGDKLPREEWEGLINHVSGKRPMTASAGGFGNAMFARPRHESQMGNLDAMVEQDPYNSQETPRSMLSTLFRSAMNGRDEFVAKRKEHHDRILSDGVVIADPDYSSGAILAHEGGHGKIEHTPGITNFLQRHVYPHARLIAPLAGAGSMAAGLASGSTLKGLLAGAGIGALSGIGTLAPEAMATSHGLKGLADYKGGALSSSADKKQLLAAFASYLAGAVLPSAAAGAAGGWLSGKRKKKQMPVKQAGAQSQALLKLNSLLEQAFHARQSGMLSGGNHAENMRQIFRTSPLLKQRFGKQPPTLNAAFDYVGNQLRKGEV